MATFVGFRSDALLLNLGEISSIRPVEERDLAHAAAVNARSVVHMVGGSKHWLSTSYEEVIEDLAMAGSLA